MKEYMDRYKIGEKTARKEIKKYKRTHPYTQSDIIVDIQESIGYTSGGFPFATAEEIAGWIQPESDSEGYPAWISDDITIDKADILHTSKLKRKKRRRRKKR
jgi:hypothetical protein